MTQFRGSMSVVVDGFGIVKKERAGIDLWFPKTLDDKLRGRQTVTNKRIYSSFPPDSYSLQPLLIYQVQLTFFMTILAANKTKHIYSYSCNMISNYIQLVSGNFV